MPRADTPCAGCGKLLQTGPNSLPAGQRMCHPCRRARPRRDPRQCALPECDVIYTPTHEAQRFCSMGCAHKNGMGGTRVLDKACDICGSQFKPSDRANYVQRTCSRKCGMELWRRGAEARRKRWPSCPIYVQECAQCDALFVARRSGQETCSKTCSRKRSWAKSNAARRVTEHVCPCGAVISPSRHKCDDCLKLARKNRRRRERGKQRHSIASEPYTLAEIAARDRYRCGLCHKKVAMTKAVPHPKAPTIDHVVPWSISKDDTRANVQLAHFICNSRKWIRGSQQLALFG